MRVVAIIGRAVAIIDRAVDMGGRVAAVTGRVAAITGRVAAVTGRVAAIVYAAGSLCCSAAGAQAERARGAEPVRDPGVRSGPVAVAMPLPDLTPLQERLFTLGKAAFAEIETVPDGLGPSMNLDNCAGCHAYPAVGGTSSAHNPQIALARFSRGSVLPSFVQLRGPVRVVRFVRDPGGALDGNVHGLLSIAGRSDADGCVLAPPDFARELARRNVVFRIPTPLFGAGLIENIPDDTILANRSAAAEQNRAWGIFGRPNRPDTYEPGAERSADDRRIGRFGWKAQNSSLLVAGAEAYAQEMGITNEIYREETVRSAACPYGTSARDGAEAAGLPDIDVVRRYRNVRGHRPTLSPQELKARQSEFARRHAEGRPQGEEGDDPAMVENAGSIEMFAAFMRFLAPPEPARDIPGGEASIARGSTLFGAVGCAACHTPTLRTGKTGDRPLRDRPVNLYSDLLLHDMGPGLADGIDQGRRAGARDFRTAPLWGLGQRLYLLHDGRNSDLLAAIEAHRSGAGKTGDASEANVVVDRFHALPRADRQHVLNFLRSL